MKWNAVPNKIRPFKRQFKISRLETEAVLADSCRIFASPFIQHRGIWRQGDTGGWASITCISGFNLSCYRISLGHDEPQTVGLEGQRYTVLIHFILKSILFKTFSEVHQCMCIKIKTKETTVDVYSRFQFQIMSFYSAQC